MGQALGFRGRTIRCASAKGYRGFRVFSWVVLWCAVFASEPMLSQSVQVAVMQYKGGGDWYSNPTSVPNLVTFCNDELGTRIDAEVPYVEVGSPALFNYPFIHMTGHGNVVFSPSEARNLRTWLEAGGFLHISDNYGMDAFVRKEMRKVFPDLDWVEFPLSTPCTMWLLTLKTDRQRSTNTTAMQPKVLVYCWMAVWSVTMTSSVTSATVGKITRSTAIPKWSGAGPLKWGRTFSPSL